MSQSWNRRQLIKLGLAAGGAAALGPQLLIRRPQPAYAQGDTIRVGLLHSATGTMAISELGVVDAELLAIEQVNEQGGVLGRLIEPILENGASDWPTFARRATKLIDEDRVATVFGCWTSASRKAVLPVFEAKRHLLWYPVQYEGQECSRHIFYTGATPNQQIEPAVEWLFENIGTSFFLVGSDYIFPRIANSTIKAQLEVLGGQVVGEVYLPLGSQEVGPIIAQIQSALPDGGVIFNTLNGDSNVAFFNQLGEADLTADQYPVMSVSVAEEEVQAIGPQRLEGHYAAWNYFMSVDTPANQAFVADYKDRYGQSRVTTDPMEAAYIMVNLWAQTANAIESIEIEDIIREAPGQQFDAPGGSVQMQTNHHLSKTVRIGQVQADGSFAIVSASPNAVQPQPWNQFIEETRGLGCDWSDPAKGGKYRV